MAIAPSNSNYKSFTFNGISARTYGVYVTDVNVFDSAQRQVEYITIPGRNGQFALDHGRFENVTVVYSCAMGADSDTDFADAIQDFRNALASTKGYQRLEDEMNPNEYRMAVFSAGITAPTLNQRTATFDVEFNCKPQRYLKSGETPKAVSDGDTLTNPTLFDASPLLEVYGYGDITLGTGGTVSVSDAVIAGNKILSNGGQVILSTPYTESIVMGSGEFMAGDTITLAPTSVTTRIDVINTITTATATVASGYAVNTSTVKPLTTRAVITVSWQEETFTVGTSKDLSTVIDITLVTGGGTISLQMPATISYDAGTDTITRELEKPTVISGTIGRMYTDAILGTITGYSTAPAYTEPLYFDLDIGTAYAIEGGQPVSINNAVSFGTDLPVLQPGTSTIAIDNTITSLTITPRWWIV